MVDKIGIIALDTDVRDLINVAATLPVAGGGAPLELSNLSSNVINYFLPARANTLNVHANTLTVSNTFTGKILYCTNASFNTVITLANTAQTGVSITMVQGTAKNVRCIPEVTASLVHKSNHANTGGRWSIISATVLENANGSGALWLLMGDTTT